MISCLNMKTPTYSARGTRIGDRILNHLECCGQPFLTPRQLIRRMRLHPSRYQEFLSEKNRLLQEGRIREQKPRRGWSWNSQLFFIQ
jgi:hypothetical protein